MHEVDAHFTEYKSCFNKFGVQYIDSYTPHFVACYSRAWTEYFTEMNRNTRAPFISKF